VCVCVCVCIHKELVQRLRWNDFIGYGCNVDVHE